MLIKNFVFNPPTLLLLIRAKRPIRFNSIKTKKSRMKMSPEYSQRIIQNCIEQYYRMKHTDISHKAITQIFRKPKECSDF